VRVLRSERVLKDRTGVPLRLPVTPTSASSSASVLGSGALGMRACRDGYGRPEPDPLLTELVVDALEGFR